MKNWITDYLTRQKAALDSIPIQTVEEIIQDLKKALKDGRRIFAFGNGGSAANASHFITDLGKGASDKVGIPFRCMSLNDNISWITAIGNDYSYDEIFLRQLINLGRPGDIVLVLSVSGSSPNVVKAVQWAKENGLYSIALVGGKKGKLANLADKLLVINDTHYGRAEDTQMVVCHLLCYAFMEHPELVAE
jgi:D-sedoheptulose 7-phosphate isomerase